MIGVRSSWLITPMNASRRASARCSLVVVRGELDRAREHARRPPRGAPRPPSPNASISVESTSTSPIPTPVPDDRDGQPRVDRRRRPRAPRPGRRRGAGRRVRYGSSVSTTRPAAARAARQALAERLVGERPDGRPDRRGRRPRRARSSRRSAGRRRRSRSRASCRIWSRSQLARRRRGDLDDQPGRRLGSERRTSSGAGHVGQAALPRDPTAPPGNAEWRRNFAISK